MNTKVISKDEITKNLILKGSQKQRKIRCKVNEAKYMFAKPNLI